MKLQIAAKQFIDEALGSRAGKDLVGKQYSSTGRLHSRDQLLTARFFLEGWGKLTGINAQEMQKIIDDCNDRNPGFTPLLPRDRFGRQYHPCYERGYGPSTVLLSGTNTKLVAAEEQFVAWHNHKSKSGHDVDPNDIHDVVKLAHEEYKKCVAADNVAEVSVVAAVPVADVESEEKIAALEKENAELRKQLQEHGGLAQRSLFSIATSGIVAGKVGLRATEGTLYIVLFLFDDGILLKSTFSQCMLVWQECRKMTRSIL